MEITHKNGAESGSFVAEENGKRMGYLSYEWASKTVFAIMHTVVEDAFRGQGVARALLNAAVDFARENGYRIRPICPYADNLFQRDKSYQDVIYIKGGNARVNQMSEAFNRLSVVVDSLKGNLAELKELAPHVDLLKEYISSGQWQEDFEADERGEIGPDVNRSVLSEDGLYNLLEDLDELMRK